MPIDVADPAGRRRRFDALFRTYYGTVERLIRSQFRSIDVATVMSATFEVAWRRFDEIPCGAEHGWLTAVARNCAVNELRAARRRRAKLDSLVLARCRLSSDDETNLCIAVQALSEALARLTQSEREVIWLAGWKGLRGVELGNALGTTALCATVRLHRARHRLWTLLTDDVADEPRV